MKSSGFTLIELSIVLVIIGLIVGGVLVGKDLIAAAEIRGTISQIEKFDTAVQTFRLKYGVIPGDMPPTTAGTLGFFQLTGTCTTCNFGNGMVDYSLGGNFPSERYIFWRHLSEANMIDGNYGRDATNTLDPVTGFPTAGTIKFFFPKAKIPEAYIEAGNDTSGIISLRVNTNTGADMAVSWTDYYFTSGTPGNPLYIYPSMAYSIDSKLDDGIPNTGKVVDIAGAHDSWDASQTIAETNGFCTFGGTQEYTPDTKYTIKVNRAACFLLIKAGF